MSHARRLSQIPEDELSAEAENVCLSCATEFRTSSGVVQTEKITCFGVTATAGEEDCEFVSVSAALNFIFQFPPTSRIDERYDSRLGCCPVCSGIIGQLYGLHKQLQELNNSHSVISMTMKSALATFAKSAPHPVLPTVRNSVIVPENMTGGPLKRARVEPLNVGGSVSGIMPKTEYSVIPGYSLHNSFQMGNGPTSQHFQGQGLGDEVTDQKPVVTYEAVEIEEQVSEGVYIIPDTDLQEGDSGETSEMKYNFITCPNCFVKVDSGKDGRGLQRHITAYHTENSGSLPSRNDHNPGNGIMPQPQGQGQGPYNYEEVNVNGGNQSGRAISEVLLE